MGVVCLCVCVCVLGGGAGRRARGAGRGARCQAGAGRQAYRVCKPIYRCEMSTYNNVFIHRYVPSNAWSLKTLFRTPLYMFNEDTQQVILWIFACLLQQELKSARCTTGWTREMIASQKIICIHTNIREPKSETHLTVEWGSVHISHVFGCPKAHYLHRGSPDYFKCRQAASFRKLKYKHGNEHFKAAATS